MTRKRASSVSVNDLDVKSHNYHYKDCVPNNKKNLKILFRGRPLPEAFHRGSLTSCFVRAFLLDC